MKKLSESEVYIRVKSMRSLFIFVIISVNTIWATHTGFTESAISTSADGAHSVYAADVDSDGDMDLLSALSGIQEDGTGLGRFNAH